MGGTKKTKADKATNEANSIATDKEFLYDQDAVEKISEDKEWEKDPKYYSKIRISALAAMKMLKHALAGVKKGREGEGGKPIEIMGLLVGKPDGNTIVVLDSYALPVEGIEYKVEAGEQAMGYMVQLMETLELRRKERFIGWYHSHPFDVSTRPQYFMSTMDVSTQTNFQNSIPQWTAIVVDPLRSLAKQEPQLGCFRVYPATHNVKKGQGPDGLQYPNPNELQQRWGASSSRYYQLEQSFFMSSLGKQMLDIMSRNNLWVRVLSSSAIMEPENRSRLAERVKASNDKLQAASTSSGSFGSFGGGGRRRKGGGGGGKDDNLKEGAQACSELAIEQCKGHASQVVKDMLFNYIVKREAERNANAMDTD